LGCGKWGDGVWGVGCGVLTGVGLLQRGEQSHTQGEKIKLALFWESGKSLTVSKL